MEKTNEIHRAEAGHWAAIMAPDANEDKLRVVVDSIVWVRFIFPVSVPFTDLT